MSNVIYLLIFTLVVGTTMQNESVQAQDVAKASHFFVAPNGNDANPGTKERPFSTLDKARDAIRVTRKNGAPFSGAHVWVRGGTYFLKQPFVLLPEDSGGDFAPIFYEAYQNEKPIFSGGQPVTNWRVAGNQWQAQLPEAAGGKWSFTRLYVNGQSRYRPRLPKQGDKQGYYFVRSELEPTAPNKDKGIDRFLFAPGDFKAGWHNLGDVEMLGMQIWSMARLRVASVDEQSGTVQFTGTTMGTPPYQKFPRGGRYLIENVKEALEPGNFYLDSKSGQLTYWPQRGEKLTQVIAPRLSTLVELRGDVPNRKWVSNIFLRGLHFAHSNWQTPPQGYSFVQAEAPLGAALTATGARRIHIENCKISQTGEYGIALNQGCKNNHISNCELTDLAAGGIKIGEMRAFDDDEDVASHNTVQNCLIAHGGRLHPAAVGIFIGHSPHNGILHNEIFDFYYTGISPGWSWGYNRSLSHHNEIAYNHIHQIGQGVLSDMGGIYTLGAGEGNYLHHNLIHDVDSFSYGGWGIYFDEGTSKLLAENNLVYRTKSAGFHQHYGKDNTVRNNIFAFGREAQLMRSRPEPEHFTLDINRNIIVYDDAPLLGSNWSGENFKLDSNLYWRLGKPVTFPGGLTLEQWQAKGQDKNSLIADPLFVNMAKDDFRLQPNSPAFKLGFKAIDLSQVGRTTAKPYKGTLPRQFPAPPPPQPPLPISENFEQLSVGAKVLDASTYEDNDKATARVTNEVAHSGKQSLKFTDAPGGAQQYNPHVFWSPGYKSGTVTETFWLRLEKGAVVSHEWRDNGSPYRTGPSIYIEADGTLKSAGTTLGELPQSQWIQFIMSCNLGEQANGEWNLKVALPDGTNINKALPCTKEFRSLTWLGFISNANDHAVWYLDDLQVTQK
ncbi:MAG TPA: right-handed parallel beta-helix repeat-containing protein [Abditibacteriaceae bacterium]